MNIDLPPQYDPKSVEAPIYKKWLASGAFHATPDAPGTPPRQHFSIVIPPPNVTGALHLGHAINGTIQDILTRYHRMKGENTMWMPGIDHAGIATQAVVERTIFEKEGKNRHDLGREELVRRIWEWKQQYGDRIISQQQSLGASCDWERTRFTLDDICAKAVREAFFKMFKDGLIFRGKRLVNWDTHLQTAVADDEIYRETIRGQMTSIRYPIARDTTPNAQRPTSNDPLEYLVVATTRPETMLGDTAVAVHPDDPRYKHLIGQHVIVPLVGRRIPIIADGLLVDPAFGTGVVKVTPAHDPNDYATGQRHKLEQINLLTPDGKVNENGQGEFLGQKYSYVGLKFATAARKQVLADLKALNVIAEEKPHDHEIGHSDRSKTPIEPYLSDQWFVKMGDIQSAPSEPPSEPTSEPTSEPRLLRSGNQAASTPPPPHSEAEAYFITFHTYATWVRGDAPASVDDAHNEYGAPFIAPDEELARQERAKAGSPFILNDSQRQSVANTIQEVAAYRGWTLRALNVRTTHVHCVVSGPDSPEKMMHGFKSYATRRMIEHGLVAREANVWSRHGSTRYLWRPDDVRAAVRYTVDNQGENLEMSAFVFERKSDLAKPLLDSRGSDCGSDRGKTGITLADGSEAPGLAQAAMDAVTSGRVKITPDRYAKSYLDWLGQKRDWCISRQLWWGHRIPVWTQHFASKNDWWGAPGSEQDSIQDQLSSLAQEGSIEIWYVPDADASKAFSRNLPEDQGFTVYVCTPSDIVKTGWADFNPSQDAKTTADAIRHAVSSSATDVLDSMTKQLLGIQSMNELAERAAKQMEDNWESMKAIASDSSNHFKDAKELLERGGFTQDPDVLDTWFSSALWPISTMGWPGGRPYSSTWSRAMWEGENYTEAAVRAYFQKHVFLPALNNDEQKAAAAMQSFACAYTGKQLDITFRDPDLESAVKNTIITMGYTHKPDGIPEPGLLETFYPTSVLSTAREILTLWVARMVIFGLYCQGDVPFKDVYIHPVIQDGEGRPMKKMLGNGVDPVDVVYSHGADALRFTLAQMTTETQDIRLPVQVVCPHCAERFPNPSNLQDKIICPKCKKPLTRAMGSATGSAEAPLARTTSDRFDLGRNFANKIWNASRFILTNIDEKHLTPNPSPLTPSALEDRWILSRLNATIAATEAAINGFHFADLATALYQFFWTDLCDWYLEISKSRLKSGDATVQAILLHCLKTSLKLLHPIMPFITEEIWSKLPSPGPTGAGSTPPLLVSSPWPTPVPLSEWSKTIPNQMQNSFADPAAESQIATVQLITSAIRDLHNTYPAAKGKDVVIRTTNPAMQALIESGRAIIEPLAGIKLAEISPTAAKPADSATKVLPDAEIYIGGVVDPEAERKKLAKRKEELLKFIAGNKTKLDNQGFVAKAPEKVVTGLREQLATQETELMAVEKNLAELA